MEQETELEFEAAISEEVGHVSSILSDMIATIKGYLPSLAFALLVFLCGVMLIKIFLKIMDRAIKKSGIDPTAGSFLHSLISVLLYVLVTIIVLSVLNVPMTSIITLLGTAGLAIGLALQDSLANVASGFIIMFTKTFKVGDLIKLDDKMGTVQSIGILHTKMLLPDHTVVTIPNGKITDAVLVNYSDQALRRLDLEIGISYSADFQRAKEIVRTIIVEHPSAVDDPSPIVRVGELGDSAVVLYVRAWTTNETYWDLYFDLLESIKIAFDREKIGIPFPQMDVHFPEEIAKNITSLKKYEIF